ncbi:flagellar basal body-associated protein FliL (plasmid) [Enterobacter asburiae]|uniref:flagellar basal body-associated protein FliL n=1 Tax=Enterobacter asburiae TaxID=61645 RepID=UPI0029338DD4|nr:flagellar basal body-associated protein FliL [Enterobacter asburiae]EMA4739810.1 flagellar basal body-associated protein FliL [Enterobacter asburiae]
MPKNKQQATGTRKSYFLIAILILTVAGIIGVGGYVYIEFNKLKNTGAKDNNAVAAVQHSPIYIPLDTFTVSLNPTDKDVDRVLYIGLTLRVRDNQSRELVQQLLPEIRSRLLILFSRQTAENLTSDNGKQRLLEIIKQEINIMQGDNQSMIVTDVLFNAFILR